jgi:glycosyltransferase involved in cell wall biosynthesis
MTTLSDTPSPVNFTPPGNHGLGPQRNHTGVAVQTVVHCLGYPTLTIVVPTRNEADNVKLLVASLNGVMPTIQKEIFFVDDSEDNTVAMIQSLQPEADCAIRFIHRPAGERTGGLGGAVVLGLSHAQAPWVCVMDSDLQHPPELVPVLLAKAEQTEADVVVASRYRNEGAAKGLTLTRKGISQAFDTTARLLFPRQLQDVSDPMSGFFLVRKSALDLDTLHPRGFKILLEILVRSNGLRTAEVPFQFGKRHAGQSKAGVREAIRYLSALFHLRVGENTQRFLRFCLVGLSGIFVNLFLQFVAATLLEQHYLIAATFATQGSTLWNFALSEAWVFPDRAQRWNRLYRLVMFLFMNNVALIFRGPVMFMLTTGLGVHYLLSNLLSLVALTMARYALADALIWKHSTTSERVY